MTNENNTGNLNKYIRDLEIKNAKSLPKNKLSKLDICWQNIIIPFGM
jgi:hypothetical protein